MRFVSSRLDHLTEIDVSNRGIGAIDESAFKALTKLGKLKLNHNELEEIASSAFQDLSDLRVISLNNNHLKRLESAAFACLFKLVVLHLDHNELEIIQPKLFEDLSNLRQLNLSWNKLTRIEAKSFNGIARLETLSLAHNRIAEIDEKAFEALGRLRDLWLNNNNLVKIDRRCLEPLKSSIKVIELYENGFTNVKSFFNPQTNLYNRDRDYYNMDKLIQYGFLSSFNAFLEQFSIIGEDLKTFRCKIKHLLIYFIFLDATKSKKVELFREESFDVKKDCENLKKEKPLIDNKENSNKEMSLKENEILLEQPNLVANNKGLNYIEYNTLYSLIAYSSYITITLKRHIFKIRSLKSS